MIWMEFHPKNLNIYIFYFYVLQGLQQVVVGLSSCSRLYWIFWNMTRVEVYFDDRLILGWFWQGFLHFHETTSLASNENIALKLEDKNEYDAMLEQEYALVQLQNEALSRNHHFKHKGEDKSGFAVVLITKASKCIPNWLYQMFWFFLPDPTKLHCPGHWCTGPGEERGSWRFASSCAAKGICGTGQRWGMLHPGLE